MSVRYGSNRGSDNGTGYGEARRRRRGGAQPGARARAGRRQRSDDYPGYDDYDYNTDYGVFDNFDDNEAYSDYRDGASSRRRSRSTSDDASDRRGRSASGRSARRSARDAAPKKRHSKLKIALVSLAVIACLGAGAAYGYYQYINNNLHVGLGGQDLSQYLVKTDLANEPFYMLLMGTDESAERDSDESFGGSFRNDSIILARIDPVNKTASLVSIHRDTMVNLGEYGEQKINAAHAFGGAALSIQAVSSMAGVDISHYAEIDFDGFKEIVDALGGVEVDVPVEIDDDEAGGHLDAGLQTLDGDQALILCRSRNTYGDYSDPDSMRAANQRLVLTAIANKILSSDVATISNCINTISKYITTDLSVSDIIGLAQAMKGMDTSTDLYTAMQPVTSEYVDGGWYSYTDETAWKKMIARMNEGLPPSETAEVDETTGTVTATNGTDIDSASTTKTASITVKNGTSRMGLAESAVTLLKDSGFVNATAGNANSTDYDKTLVIYDNANQEYEADQIVEALGQGTAMKNDGNWLYDGNFLVIIGSDWKSS